MNKIAKYMAMVLMTIGAFAFFSCHGQSDDPIDNGDPKTEVPNGVLRVFADRTTIVADGSDMVTFTVMFGSEDVSTARTLQLVRTIDGNEKVMDYGVNTFSTAIPGTYTFKAEFYRSGRYYSDNEVEILATPSVVDGDTKQWAQRVLGFQFTSVGCSYCPVLSTSLKMIQENFEDRLAVVSFHSDFNNMSDPMTHSMTSSYYKLLNRSGLPQFCPNLITEDEFIIVNEYDKIVTALDRVEQEYPTTCGVAIESSMVVGGERAVKVTVKVTSNTPSAYRYQVFLVEDGIVATQMGIDGNDAGNYVHNNVVRGVLFETTYGSTFNEGANLQVGVEATAERTMQIPAGCNIENMRVVVAALSSYDNGRSYIVNNCAECPVGESVDYAIKTAE